MLDVSQRRVDGGPLSAKDLRKARKHRPSYGWSRFWLPYCFERMDAPDLGKWVYLPLNRNYKPLGTPPKSDWVKYEDYRSHFIAFKSNPTNLEGVWFSMWGESRLYLYNDNPDTCVDYFDRLARALMATVGQP